MTWHPSANCWEYPALWLEVSMWWLFLTILEGGASANCNAGTHIALWGSLACWICWSVMMCWVYKMCSFNHIPRTIFWIIALKQIEYKLDIRSHRGEKVGAVFFIFWIENVAMSITQWPYTFCVFVGTGSLCGIFMLALWLYYGLFWPFMSQCM